MRLGADPVKLHAGTRAREIYGEAVIYERHRHRYEVSISPAQAARGRRACRLRHVARRAARRDHRAAPTTRSSSPRSSTRSSSRAPSAPRRCSATSSAPRCAARGRAARGRGPRLAAARSQAGRAERADARRAPARPRSSAGGSTTCSPSSARSPARSGHEAAVADRVAASCGARLEVERGRRGAEIGAAPATCWRACRAARALACCSARTSTPSRTTASDRAGARRRRLGERQRRDPRRRQQGGGRGAARARAPRGGRGLAGRRRAALHRQRGERRSPAPRPFDVSQLRSRRSATSSTTPRRSARSSWPRRPTTASRPSSAARAAHAGIRPEDGRSAIVAAARGDRRDAPRPHRRGDDGQRRRRSRGGAGGTNVVRRALHVRSPRRARSTTRRPRRVVAEMVDHCHDAANDPPCECDVDVTVERLFERLPPQATRAGRRRGRGGAARLRLHAARASSPAAARTPTPSRPTGFHCINLANGTERNHEPTERVSQSPRWRACST